MDLTTWIGDDLRSLSRRLQGGVLDKIPAERRGERPDGGGVAPTYVLWHLARHHDLAMNRVVDEASELVGGWTDRLGVDTDLWRGLSEGEDQDLVALLDPVAVGEYTIAVIDHSVEVVARLDIGDLARVPASADALSAAGVPSDRFDWLYSMWADQPLSFFVQWVAVGHGYNHLGELTSIRNRMGLNPF